MNPLNNIIKTISRNSEKDLEKLVGDLTIKLKRPLNHEDIMIISEAFCEGAKSATLSIKEVVMQEHTRNQMDNIFKNTDHGDAT